MRERQSHSYDHTCFNRCLWCCVPAICLTELFYRLLSCCKISQTRVKPRKYQTK